MPKQQTRRKGPGRDARRRVSLPASLEGRALEKAALRGDWLEVHNRGSRSFELVFGPAADTQPKRGSEPEQTVGSTQSRRTIMSAAATEIPIRHSQIVHAVETTESVRQGCFGNHSKTLE